MKPDLFNPRWRLNNLYKIRTKSSKIIKFQENDVQSILNDRVRNVNRYTILKARQFGISTNEILKLFDKTIFNENQETCILAHKNDSLEKLFVIVKCAYNNLKNKPEIAKGGGSKYEMYFPRLNSRIYVSLEVRGGTIHNLHVSELAFFKEMSKLQATLEAVPLDGHVSIETTPNGMNEFYDLYNDPDSGYLNLFFPWYCFSEYRLQTEIKKSSYSSDELGLIEKAKKYGVSISKEQIAFRRFKLNQNKDLFLQEYPEDDVTCFLSSGNPFFDLTEIKKALNMAPKPIKHTGTLTVFEEPIPNRVYVAGADTAEGVGGDFSAMSVFDVKTQKQVLQLHGHWKPSIFAERMNAILKQYHAQGVPPLLGIERNNHGHAVILAMQNLKYSNLYLDSDEREGWLTNKVSKPIMLNAFKDFIETTPGNIKDKVLLKECLTFINNSGKIEAISGKHDDCIIASAIAIQMLIKKLSVVDYDKAIDSFYTIDGGVEGEHI